MSIMRNGRKNMGRNVRNVGIFTETLFPEAASELEIVS